MRNQIESLNDYTRYLHLEQDAAEFKAIRYELENFNIVMSEFRSDTAPAAKETSVTKVSAEQTQSRINHSFWTRSKNLFNSLSTHLKPCTEKHSKHKAMLHLTYFQDLQESVLYPELSMLLASCSDQKIWQQMHYTMSSQKSDLGQNGVFNSPSGTHDLVTNDLPPMNPNTAITSICQHALNAYGNQQIFKLQLSGQSFLDMSDVMFQPTHPEAEPTISLHDLLKHGMLKDRYKFYHNDKKILVYTLSHALLYLHEGPWLQNLWTLDNLFFMYETDTSKVYNVHQPYISCVLSPDPPPLGTLDSLHQYPLIFSFAKLLLELETGEEIEPARKNKDG